jgi:hypothetical protein
MFALRVPFAIISLTPINVSGLGTLASVTAFLLKIAQTPTPSPLVPGGVSRGRHVEFDL